MGSYLVCKGAISIEEVMDVDADCQLVKDYIAFGLILKQDVIILIVPALNNTMTKELQYVKSGLLIIRYLNLGL